MQLLWILAVTAGLIAILLMGAQIGRGARRQATNGGRQADGRSGRDLGANINPSQTGNEVNLWPDRTGARTRRELGARHAVDMTFAGDREEQKAPAGGGTAIGGPGQAAPGGPGQFTPGGDGQAAAVVTAGSLDPTGMTPLGVAQAQSPRAGLDPEAEFGENRVAPRTTAPDQPPTQWHKEENGVPGDHYRDGHHRSATAPERRSTATDPYAHAPVPGPNHLPPDGGADLPDQARP